MKKYLITGLAAVAISGMFTSCTHETDAGAGGTNLGVVETYEQAFISRFGTPSPDADWGFGPSKASTRAAMPDAPSFSDKATAIDPKKPTEPTFSRTFYNKLSDASSPIYSGDVADDNAWNAISNAIVYIDSKSSKVGSNSQNMTIIVNETMSFNAGGLNTNGNGPVICVAEGKTLTLTGMKQNITIYLAPGANLNATQVSSFANCNLIMSGNNTVTGGAMNFSYGSIVNKGGTITATSIQLDNSTNLWNEGTINVSGSLNSNNQNSNIYNANTITAASMTLDQSATLWNEGTIQLKNSDGTYTTSNKLEGKNTNIIIYNASGKTIELGSIELKSSAPEILYNDGTVTCHGEISLDNTADEIINNGTLTATSLNMKAGGKMYNTVTTNISGLTKISNSNCQWQNDGQYTSGSFEVDQYAVKNFNNCKLIVNGNFWLNRGTFVLNSGASVVCNTFTWEDTSDFYLGGKSLLKVSGQFLTKNANSGYGLRGVGSDYAVVQASSIAHQGNEQFRMSYYGNLFIATDNHFEQWYKDNPNTNQPAYWYESSVKFKFKGETTATIPETPCNPGYEGEEPGGGDETGGGDDETTPSIRVIAEDMGDKSLKEASDFDFNDVVFDVTWVSESKVKIKILAAGGTLPLTVGWDGTEDPNDPKAYIKHEVHYMLGYSESTMINTHSTVGNYKDGVPPYEFEFTGSFKKESFAADVRDKIPVKVRKNGVWYDIKADQGKAPGKIAVGTDYNPWCDERVDIDFWWQNNDFKGLFYLYTQSPATLTKFWYKQATYRNGELISK